MPRRKSKNPAKASDKKAAARRRGGKKGGGRRASGKKLADETKASFIKG